MELRSLASALALLSLTAAPAFADWGATAITLGADGAGATGTVDCAPGGVTGAVWGTGTYTSDSSVCTAAVHFGWMTQAEGGRVSFRQVDGLGAYQSSTQNGVTSSEYGSWESSFQITGVTPIAAGPAPIVLDWGTNLDAIGLGDQAGTVHALLCPPGGATGVPIWGVDVYTSDSAICVAAVHRGVINASNGGPVTILVLGGQPAYGTLERNGVTSLDYPEWPRSYVFQ